MKPFVKWAGGKSQLLTEINRRLPNDYNKYIEPFVGGGAVFFSVEGNKSIINDANKQLINTYVQIRDNTNILIGFLDELEIKFNTLLSSEDKEKFFYQSREEFNHYIVHNEGGIKEAGLFIFLNKTCFNGLYRINSKGEFNAPFGKKNIVSIYERSNLAACSSKLKTATILNDDFTIACKNLRARNFVFFDSPYYKTFDTYQKNGFSESDHLRLFSLFKKLSDRGVYCMLTNSDEPYILDLYRDYTIESVPVKRMINCDGANRSGREVIITNY